MIEMTEENYGDIEISHFDFINHQYFANPVGEPYIQLAYDEENNKLAGQYIVIPMKLRINKKDYTCVLSLNTLTHEEFRGQGVFTTLAEDLFANCKEKNVLFCYGAPNPNSYPGFTKKLAFQDIGTVPLYLRVLKPSLLIGKKLRLNFIQKLVRPVDCLFKVKKTKTNKYKIISITENNVQLLDELNNLVKNKYPVMFVKDAAFILWRYIRMPLREYKIYAIIENTSPIGYIVGRISNIADMKCGLITDFIFKKNCRIAGNVLVDKILQHFAKHNVELSGCLMKKHFEEAKVLRDKRYIQCPKLLEPQPFPIIYKGLSDDYKTFQTELFKNSFFTMGDYDVI